MLGKKQKFKHIYLVGDMWHPRKLIEKATHTKDNLKNIRLKDRNIISTHCLFNRLMSPLKIQTFLSFLYFKIIILFN